MGQSREPLDPDALGGDRRTGTRGALGAATAAARAHPARGDAGRAAARPDDPAESRARGRGASEAGTGSDAPGGADLSHEAEPDVPLLSFRLKRARASHRVPQRERLGAPALAK